MEETKKDLRDEITKLKKEGKEKDEKAILSFTKTELKDFIKKEVLGNLTVEVKEGEIYQYGGGYKPHKVIGVFWGDEQVYESISFE